MQGLLSPRTPLRYISSAFLGMMCSTRLRAGGLISSNIVPLQGLRVSSGGYASLGRFFS